MGGNTGWLNNNPTLQGLPQTANVMVQQALAQAVAPPAPKFVGTPFDGEYFLTDNYSPPSRPASPPQTSAYGNYFLTNGINPWGDMVQQRLAGVTVGTAQNQMMSAMAQGAGGKRISPTPTTLPPPMSMANGQYSLTNNYTPHPLNVGSMVTRIQGAAQGMLPNSPAEQVYLQEVRSNTPAPQRAPQPAPAPRAQAPVRQAPRAPAPRAQAPAPQQGGTARIWGGGRSMSYAPTGGGQRAYIGNATPLVDTGVLPANYGRPVEQAPYQPAYHYPVAPLGGYQFNMDSMPSHLPPPPPVAPNQAGWDFSGLGAVLIDESQLPAMGY